ncbi:hypothetical protein [Acidiphilium sp. C61]|uniref:hypothetical protein n=1 Tax=Acidiphilium sp. C61 TaxID=1671485 RepID=UPI00157AD6CC|nr:hypothetical protein [Acidiphilium sp. C61]
MENQDITAGNEDLIDAAELDEHIDRLPDDASIRRWLASLPPYLADFGRDLPQEDLGVLLKIAMRSDVDEPDFASVCDDMGRGGRLRMLAVMMASMDGDGHLLMEILLGHGPAQSMIREDIDTLAARIGSRALEMLIETPGFIAGVRAAMPLVSRSPSMARFPRNTMERSDA